MKQCQQTLFSFPSNDEVIPVEVATGELDSFESAESWQGETREMGQVATPQLVAVVMAKWVMSAKPHASPTLVMISMEHSNAYANDRPCWPVRSPF